VPPPPRGQFNERWPYAKLRDLYARVIETTARRYDGRVPYVEVMNEAHDKANLWRMNHGQILDMARVAMAAARRGSETIKRQMNHCCLWSEYAQRRNAERSRRWSPWQFVKACFDNGIDYEVIGLQLYYPQFDLFEIDRMLDRFKIFGRPLHITEIATASQDGLDPESMRPRTAAPGWHGPWTEAMQADWVEGIYTLVYSKSEFEAIGWWDLSDAPGHFWPHGGLLRKDMTPKEAVGRLVELKRRWGV
jgi:GH35 family endo-1,4-beta-xylanase